MTNASSSLDEDLLPAPGQSKWRTFWITDREDVRSTVACRGRVTLFLKEIGVRPGSRPRFRAVRRRGDVRPRRPGHRDPRRNRRRGGRAVGHHPRRASRRVCAHLRSPARGQPFSLGQTRGNGGTHRRIATTGNVRLRKGQANLPRACVVNVNQLRTVDLERVQNADPFAHRVARTSLTGRSAMMVCEPWAAGNPARLREAATTSGSTSSN
jgi:mRNA-degrading endonuclease toxin of MazEF toxin-antitoxin module